MKKNPISEMLYKHSSEILSAAEYQKVEQTKGVKLLNLGPSCKNPKLDLIEATNEETQDRFTFYIQRAE